MRKKITGTIIISLMLCLMPSFVYAADPVASITGPSVVRAGDTITIAFKMNGTNISSVMGEITYDSTKMTYKSQGATLKDWSVENMDSTVAGTVSFWLDDKTMSAPINSSKQLFTLTFQVKSTVATDTVLTIRTNNVAASDGTNDFSPSASYSVRLAAPLSTNAFLSGLTVQNVTISPSFTRNTAEYTASVPFETSKLVITAVTEDSKAKVSITGNDLAAGSTTPVTVTVTAENGTQKIYTLRVTREADPNYVPGSNAKMNWILVDGFFLSPVFNPDTTSYIIWLPYETTEVHISGAPSDSRASVTITGGDRLEAGKDNLIRVVCTAEDKTTKKEYTIVAKRAAPFGASTGESAYLSSAGSSSSQELSAVSEGGDNRTNGLQAWIILLIALACLVIGFAGGIYSSRMDKEK